MADDLEARRIAGLRQMMETGSVDDAEALDELLIAALPDGITCEGMNPSESSNEVRA